MSMHQRKIKQLKLHVYCVYVCFNLDSVENTIYNDDGKTIKFTILIGTLVKQFPLEKLDHLKCLIKSKCFIPYS